MILALYSHSSETDIVNVTHHQMKHKHCVSMTGFTAAAHAQMKTLLYICSSEHPGHLHSGGPKTLYKGQHVYNSHLTNTQLSVNRLALKCLSFKPLLHKKTK